MKPALGIDLSAHICGYAVLKANGTPDAHGVVETDEKDDYWTRQDTVVRVIEGILDANPEIEVVVWEQVRQFHQGRINLASIRDLSRLSGAIGLIVHRRGLEIVEVHTGHWRARVLGDGRATKDDVVAWVAERYKISASKPDEAEAVCLARYGQIAGSTIQAKRARDNGHHSGIRRRRQPLASRDPIDRERGGDHPCRPSGRRSSPKPTLRTGRGGMARVR